MLFNVIQMLFKFFLPLSSLRKTWKIFPRQKIHIWRKVLLLLSKCSHHLFLLSQLYQKPAKTCKNVEIWTRANADPSVGTQCHICSWRGICVAVCIFQLSSNKVTSGIKTSSPVAASVPAPMATRNCSRRWKMLLAMRGVSSTPMFDSIATKLTNPMP